MSNTAVDECYELKDKEVTCSVCLELFSLPKTLPCRHSFCSQCIGQLLQQKPGQSCMLCPKCKEKHNKVIVYQLATNKTLQRATINSTKELTNKDKTTPENLCDETFQQKSLQPPNRTNHLMETLTVLTKAPSHTLKDDRLIFHQRVTAVTALPDNSVCFSTDAKLYYYNKSGQLKWNANIEGVRSVDVTENELLVLKKEDKVYWTGEFFSSWCIQVMDMTGVVLRKLHAGLGEDCSLTCLRTQRALAVCDSGSYQHHAQPCIILMNRDGCERRVMINKTKLYRLLKPTKVHEVPNTRHILVYDYGRNEMICFDTEYSTLERLWSLDIKHCLSMTFLPHSTTLFVFTRDNIKVLDIHSRRITNHTRQVQGHITDVSIKGDMIVLANDKSCLVYDLERQSQNLPDEGHQSPQPRETKTTVLETKLTAMPC